MLNDFLKKIKLTTDFSLSLPMGRNDFLNKLSAVTLSSTPLFESLVNRDKIFVGQVNFDEIAIRPKRTVGQKNLLHATKLSAKLNSTSNSIHIEGGIRLGKAYPYLMLFILLFHFIIAFVVMSKLESFILLAFSTQMLFLFGVMYVLFRRAITKSKDFFEKELYFLTRQM